MRTPGSAYESTLIACGHAKHSFAAYMSFFKVGASHRHLSAGSM